MTLTMYDGPPGNLPGGADAYAGYVNKSGIGATWPAVEAIPAPFHLSITTNGSIAMCADVERGAMNNWRGYTVGYCSVSNVNNMVANYGRPHKLWTAHTGEGQHICGPKTCNYGGNLVTSADGTQWNSPGAFDQSILLPDFFDFLSPAPPSPFPGGNDVPAATDVVDSWSVPGSDGAQYFDLHADGGVFAYGGAVPTELEYVASGSDGARYHFGPKQTPGVISYPGLPAADRQGSRYFNAFTVLSYNGVVNPGA